MHTQQLSQGGAAPVAATAHPRRRLAMFILLSASFMNLLDASILNVALPDLQRRLAASDRALEWIVTVYIVTFALGLLPLGRLGDILGRKGMFMTGVAGFTLTSMLCAAAPSSTALILCRALQGLTAAMLAPQVMAIAVTMFAPKDRARAFALFGLIAGLSSMAGPLLGGMLIQANLNDLGWRWIFLVNLPIGLLTLAGAWFWLPKPQPGPNQGNDWVGIALAAAAILCLLYPLIEGRAHGWPMWSMAALAAVAPLLLGFVGWERRQGRLGRAQLLPLELMASRDYLLGAIGALVFFSALNGFFLVFVICLQHGLGFSAMKAGLTSSAFPLGVLLATGVSVRLSSLKLKIAGGALLLVAAHAVLWGVMARSAGIPAALPMALTLLAGGLGSGVAVAALFQTVMRTVPLPHAGVGSGALQVFQQVGAALGIALVSQLFFSALQSAERTGVAPGPAYVQAFGQTVWYYIVAYALVAASVLWFKFGPPASLPGAGPRPVPGPGPGPSMGPGPGPGLGQAPAAARPPRS
ncbi:MFS transporter [Rugamonas sp. CCM 8940]|uniref:MFS transporter n=1 Tax=Rugamonas sp. CCM 8940 TaxID=2765359 RepID=UPI0018F50321|nr:MFS transporter [Rugamonas sp. CCM 8940]MBJ7308881.1 MFS transporter [Rugamonas sp. CCM 8940]